MTDLHKALNAKDIAKIKWCATIAMYLQKSDWTFEQGYELAETLHYDYVEMLDDGEEFPDPIEALLEEMTYWGD